MNTAGAGALSALDHEVAIPGLGYIGLPAAALLASFGWLVCGVDVSENIVDTVNAGGVHIEEHDLGWLLGETIASERLVVFTKFPSASYYMIAASTPLGPNNSPDISYVEAAARTIAPKILPGACIIVESKSPVGTTERVAQTMPTCGPGLLCPTTARLTNVTLRWPIVPNACCPARSSLSWRRMIV